MNKYYDYKEDRKYLRKNGITMRQCISSIDLKKAYDSVRREGLYNIEFGIPKKLVRLIKMCLKHTTESRCVRICLRCFQLGMV
jgi:hypothetical protein